MKRIKIDIEIPEKKDIIKNMDLFTNQQIHLFISDFEGGVKQWALTRKTAKFDEYYSMKTMTVYQIDKQGYYYKIYFKEERPENVGFGFNPETFEPHAFCKICNSIFFSAPDLKDEIRSACKCTYPGHSQSKN